MFVTNIEKILCLPIIKLNYGYMIHYTLTWQKNLKLKFFHLPVVYLAWKHQN